MAYKGFQELKVWQKARELRKEIFKLSGSFPKDELYALTSQVRRAAYSVTANIAEGHGRYHYQENMQACRIARGSLNEVIDHLITAMDNGYISGKDFDALRSVAGEVEAMLNGYSSYLEKSKSKPSKLVLFLLVNLLTYQLVSPLSAADWPTFMGNNERTGFTGQTLLPPFSEEWRFYVQGDVVSSPVVYDGVVYVGARSGSIYALNASNGNLIWDYSTDGFIDATPYVTSTSVITPSMDSNLYCFDRFNGNILWRTALGGPSVSSPLMLDGYVYVGVGSPENSFKAFNVSDGTLLFSRPVGQPVYSAPSTDGSSVYFGANNGKIYGLNALSGTEIFSYQFTGGAFNMNSTAYSTGTVFSVPGYDERRIFKTRVSDGALLSQSSDLTENIGTSEWNWQRTGSPLISSSSIYAVAGSADYYLMGVSRSDLSAVVLSSVSFGPIGDLGILPSLSMANEMIFTVTPDARFMVISSTGGILQKINLSTSAYSTPAVSNGRVFIGTNGGQVIAFKASKYLSLSAPADGWVVSGTCAIKADMLNPDATGYILEYAPEGDENFLFLSSGSYSGNELSAQTLFNWNTASLANGVYRLKISLTGDSVSSFESAAYSAFRINQRPEPPSSLNALDNPGDNGNKIILSWQASPSSAQNYRVYRTTGSVYSLLGSTVPLSYLDSSAVTGTTYTYKVSAFDGWLESVLSAPASAFSSSQNPLNDASAPSAITDLTAVPGPAGGRVSLYWTAPGDDGSVGTAFYYSVKYSSVSCSATWSGSPVWKSSRPVTGIAGTPETEIVSGLSGGVTYYFFLKSYDAGLNESPVSNCATAYAAVDYVPPGPPSGLSVSDTPGDKGGRLTLVWTLSPDDGGGADDVYGYRIFRSTKSGVYDYSVQYASVTRGAAGYIDTAALLNVKYFYRAAAFDSSNLSFSTAEVYGISADNWRHVDAGRGGNVPSDDGAELYIPPNSLNQNDSMLVVKLDPGTLQPLGKMRTNTAAVPTGIVYEVKFDKATTKLLNAATIKIPYTLSAVAGMNEENLRLYQRVGSSWLILDSSAVLADEKKVSARITSLGVYSIMEYRPSGDIVNSAEVYTYPNPANGDTATFKFRVSEKSYVKIEVYNVAGEKVASLSKADCPAGTTSEIVWNIRGIASGIYIYRLEVVSSRGSKSLNKKMAIAH